MNFSHESHTHRQILSINLNLKSSPNNADLGKILTYILKFAFSDWNTLIMASRDRYFCYSAYKRPLRCFP